MKVCAKCGRTGEDDLEVCKKCGGEMLSMPAPNAGEKNDKQRKRDWIFILIAVPLLILAIRFFIQFVQGVAL